MPTLLSLAGIDAPKERLLDGVDLSPVLLERKALPDRPLFWASLSNHGARCEAMRQGPWKLVVTHPGAKPGTFEKEQVALFAPVVGLPSAGLSTSDSGRSVAESVAHNAGPPL